ncbi:MAG: tellurium resistance protein TerC [Myxococcales bacterium]|nr:tellurium resistance protein TerC [Myxococcales bacterium]
MAELFTIHSLFNLLVLLFLQAVLGFDNLLYISIESKRAPPESQKTVRRNAILIAIALRIVLLFVIINLVEMLKEPFFHLDFTGVVEGSFNFSVLVFLFGGAFIMYTAVKEISHMLAIDDLAHDVEQRASKTAAQVTATLVVMNLVFSFDSILSALAITKVFAVLTLAIIGSGLAMLFLADHVSEFLKKNRKYEVLGLFILLIVGVVLLGEGGHVGHIKLFGYAVEPLSKTTFYFSIAVLVLVDVVQGRYQTKLDAERKAAH